VQRRCRDTVVRNGDVRVCSGTKQHGGGLDEDNGKRGANASRLPEEAGTQAFVQVNNFAPVQPCPDFGCLLVVDIIKVLHCAPPFLSVHTDSSNESGIAQGFLTIYSVDGT
jgi:hypothetical protein